jgi:predicted pyridoxine 5'-phosphate oxidase superfamily flavin-nucleotide-binding protein
MAMAKVPKEVQEFLPGKMGWVATATLDGVPNTTPKGSVQILDDEHLIFADLFSLKTRENLEKNPRVAVTVVDEKSAKGYQIKGVVELIASGPLYERMAEKLKQASAQLPPPKYVVKIAVDSVYDQSVGPNAGKRLV